MTPVIVDPNNYEKRSAYDSTRTLVESFLKLNGIVLPRMYLTEPAASLKPPGKNPWHDKGWYWNGVVFVNLKRSRVPVKTPGFQWSYTGFKSDITAPGILAHEIGHHVHFYYKRHVFDEVADTELNDVIDETVKLEANVSGYEPNRYEMFAEAMRLFILNPTLLEEGRPMRWKMLQNLNLKQVHCTPWREVLQNAHPRLISATENWIKKCTST